MTLTVRTGGGGEGVLWRYRHAHRFNEFRPSLSIHINRLLCAISILYYQLFPVQLCFFWVYDLSGFCDPVLNYKQTITQCQYSMQSQLDTSMELPRDIWLAKTIVTNQFFWVAPDMPGQAPNYWCALYYQVLLNSPV